jgi:hypothetical protein
MRDVLWRQFGAAIDMLENAVRACPDKLWGDRERNPQYWALVFDVLFFLDYYLSDTYDGFAPPEPFGMTEMDPAGILPERVYTKDEMLAYLEHGRAKLAGVLARPEIFDTSRRFGSVDGTVLEGLLYTMRHVQHHTDQLNLLLRQEIDDAPLWVGKARREFIPT